MKKFLFIILSLIFLTTPVAYIKADTTVKPVKILLVPGHDNETWGAQFNTTKEADMNLDLATRIYNILKTDKRFQVYIARDGSTPLGYSETFNDYFTQNRSAILSFEQKAKDAVAQKIDSGEFVEKSIVPHHSVGADVAVRLYGINKWANENNIDAVIHIHFNDYPRPYLWTIGTYKGFTVYFPEGHLANWFPSSQLAANIYTQLAKKYTTSTFPQEKGGLIPDQKLIALGANGTLSSTVRSVLVEYGYIYEKKFRTSASRADNFAAMASLTATGIKNYFFGK